MMEDAIELPVSPASRQSNDNNESNNGSSDGPADAFTAEKGITTKLEDYWKEFLLISITSTEGEIRVDGAFDAPKKRES